MTTFIISTISFAGGVVLGYWFRHRVAAKAADRLSKNLK